MIIKGSKSWFFIKRVLIIKGSKNSLGFSSNGTWSSRAENLGFSWNNFPICIRVTNNFPICTHSVQIRFEYLTSAVQNVLTQFFGLCKLGFQVGNKRWMKESQETPGLCCLLVWHWCWCNDDVAYMVDVAKRCWDTWVDQICCTRISWKCSEGEIVRFVESISRMMNSCEIEQWGKKCIQDCCGGERETILCSLFGGILTCSNLLGT